MRLVHWAVGAVVSAMAVACGGSTEVDVAPLREAGAPPAYWLGEEFEGLPLTANAGSATLPNFVYGTCEIPRGSDGGCAPPLQLQHWLVAERSPGMFEVAPGRRTSCRLVGDGRVTAATFETTGGVEVYVGERVVVLFGEPKLIRTALSELRPVKAQEPALPAPPGWVRAALERCAPRSPSAKLLELSSGGAAVYWVGGSFEGHPLATAEGDATEVRIVYGECAREELAFDAPCWPPLEIRIGAQQSPATYAEAIPCRTGEAQGVPTALLAEAHTLDVFAGARTIRLIGPDLELLARAAGSLRRFGEPAPTNRLPAPSSLLARSLRERCG